MDHTLPHYIDILVIHCMLLLAEILLILKITLQNAKNAALQFLKKKKEVNLLRSEFQMIIQMLAY